MPTNKNEVERLHDILTTNGIEHSYYAQPFPVLYYQTSNNTIQFDIYESNWDNLIEVNYHGVLENRVNTMAAEEAAKLIKEQWIKDALNLSSVARISLGQAIQLLRVGLSDYITLAWIQTDTNSDYSRETLTVEQIAEKYDLNATLIKSIEPLPPCSGFPTPQGLFELEVHISVFRKRQYDVTLSKSYNVRVAATNEEEAKAIALNKSGVMTAVKTEVSKVTQLPPLHNTET